HLSKHLSISETRRRPDHRRVRSHAGAHHRGVRGSHHHPGVKCQRDLHFRRKFPRQHRLVTALHLCHPGPLEACYRWFVSPLIESHPGPFRWKGREVALHSSFSRNRPATCRETGSCTFRPEIDGQLQKLLPPELPDGGTWEEK